MTVTKHSDFWELCGSAAYYLRQDKRVVNDKVVPLFLTSCKVKSEHLQMFIDSLRYDASTNRQMPDSRSVNFKYLIFLQMQFFIV